MKEFFQEIINSLSNNKLRTGLTGFAVAWGIFIIILLLAAANGFNNGMMNNFSYMKANTISLYPQWVTQPYKGMAANRKITFNQADIEKIRKGLNSFAKVEAFSPIYNNWSSTVVYNNIYTTVNITGVRPDYIKLRYMKIVSGRFINDRDEENLEKVVVIHQNTADLFFGGESPLGKYITMSGILFKVIGVYTEQGMSYQPPVYVPFETSQVIFNSSRQITDISFMVDGMDDKESIEKLHQSIRNLVAQIKIFDPEDTRALTISDRRVMMSNFNSLTAVINIFMWLIGLASLLAGIVGVSNIMIVAVSERTKEFGIRKALGAPPSLILRSVLGESLTVTLIFGVIGMTFGIAITEAVSLVLEAIPDLGNNIFMNPTVDIQSALSALFVLIVAGLVAGYVPARKAVKIKPIEAINTK